MKNKLFLFLAVAGFAIAVASCSGKKNESTATNDTTKVDTTQVAADTTASVAGKDTVSATTAK